MNHQWNSLQVLTLWDLTFVCLSTCLMFRLVWYEDMIVMFRVYSVCIVTVCEVSCCVSSLYILSWSCVSFNGLQPSHWLQIPTLSPYWCWGKWLNNSMNMPLNASEIVKQIKCDINCYFCQILFLYLFYLCINILIGLLSNLIVYFVYLFIRFLLFIYYINRSGETNRHNVQWENNWLLTPLYTYNTYIYFSSDFWCI